MRHLTQDFLTDHRLRRVEALTERLVTEIVDSNPGYRDMPVVPLEDLRDSCRRNIVRVLELLAMSFGAGSSDEGPAYDAAEETGRRRAQQGLPLDDVLGSFRIGGRLIWEDLIDHAQADRVLDAAELREIGARLWVVVDRTSSHVARAYHATERELARADEQRRTALWEELLGGRAREPGFAATAAGVLGLPLRGPYAAVMLSGAVGDLAEHLERVGIHSVWHRRSDSVVGVLTLSAVPIGAAVEVLQRAGARGAVSGVVADLTGLGPAFEQAGVGVRTIPAGEATVVAFDERQVEALLLGSPEIADRLVERWLGPVLALPRAERDALLATLGSWVEAGGSMTRAAELAHCHRNTVMNRVARVAALIGIPLGDGPAPVDLALALRWRSLAG